MLWVLWGRTTYSKNTEESSEVNTKLSPESHPRSESTPLNYSNEEKEVEEKFLQEFQNTFSKKDIDIINTVPELYNTINEYYVFDKKIPQILNFVVGAAMSSIDQNKAMLLLTLDCLSEDKNPYVFSQAVFAKHYTVAKKIVEDGKIIDDVSQKQALYEASKEHDVEAFKFILSTIKDKDFVAKHSKEIFTSANILMSDEEINYFRPEFIKFIAKELKSSLGLKGSLKECIRASIDFGGYSCSDNEFFKAVLLAFPEIPISAKEILERLERENNYYLTEDTNEELILHEENTEKCIGEILKEHHIEEG